VVEYVKLVRLRTSKDSEASETSKTQQQKKLYDALRNVGFVYLQNHSIPPAAQQQLFDHAKRFFAQSDSEKVNIETGEAEAFHG